MQTLTLGTLGLFAAALLFLPTPRRSHRVSSSHSSISQVLLTITLLEILTLALLEILTLATL